MNPSNIAIENFSEVGKLAIKQELKMRLLANKIKQIQDSAFERNLSTVEEAIVNHFSLLHQITSEESQLLSKSRQIRNKILHCEFDAAIELIEKFNNKSLPGPSVTILHLDDLKGEELLKRIENYAQHARPVSSLSLKEAGIFGWLMQITQSGGFEEAVKIFQRSNQIIDRLISLE